MPSRLIRWNWLYRSVAIDLPGGPHVVEYNGAGLGYESVSVNGVTTRETSWYWFVPRFEAKLRGMPLVVEVRVWPWLWLRSLVIRVKGRVVYAEGSGASENLDPDDLA